MKKIKIQTEEQKEMTRFVLVLLGLIIIVVAIYFLTRAFVTKDLFNKDNDDAYTSGQVSETAVIVGNMLNRPEKEYYVALYDFEDSESFYYSALITNYSSNEDKALKFYYVDLSNKLNSKYLATESEPASKSFQSLDKLRLGSITIIKVKNQEVVKFLTTEDEIKKELTIED